jgi:hypothetical protein
MKLINRKEIEVAIHTGKKTASKINEISIAVKGTPL